MELLHDEEAKKKSRAAAVVDEIFFALEEDATPLRKEEERSDDMRFGSDGVCVSKFGEGRDFFPLFLQPFSFWKRILLLFLLAKSKSRHFNLGKDSEPLSSAFKLRLGTTILFFHLYSYTVKSLQTLFCLR